MTRTAEACDEHAITVEKNKVTADVQLAMRVSRQSRRLHREQDHSWGDRYSRYMRHTHPTSSMRSSFPSGSHGQAYEEDRITRQQVRDHAWTFSADPESKRRFSSRTRLQSGGIRPTWITQLDEEDRPARPRHRHVTGVWLSAIAAPPGGGVVSSRGCAGSSDDL